VLALAFVAGLAILALFLTLSLAGIPITRSGRDPGPFGLVLVALFFAAAIALFQLAGLVLLRFLPWPDPRLKIEARGEEELRRVFE
jgi:hypothetical protein